MSVLNKPPGDSVGHWIKLRLYPADKAEPLTTGSLSWLHLRITWVASEVCWYLGLSPDIDVISLEPRYQYSFKAPVYF